jgi:hypothetical protein
MKRKIKKLDKPTFGETAWSDDSFEVEHEGFTVRVRFDYDTDPDLSHIGEFSDTPEDGAIDHHATGKWLGRSHRGDRYFNSAYFADGLKYYLETEKLSEEEARAKADRAALQDYERLVGYYTDEWSYLGMIVTIFLKGVKLGESSVWGVESDAGSAHFTEMYEEQLHEAMIDARKTLDGLIEAAEKLPKVGA